jgi:succinate-acetate transporter protein
LPHPEFYRPYLTILIWGLICEIIVMIYYITNNRYPFEFYLTFGLFWITLGEITRVIYTIRKEVKEEL